MGSQGPVLTYDPMCFCQLSLRLGATGFPYMCLLAYSGARLQLVSSIEGHLSPGEVIRVMQQAVDEQGALMVAEGVERDQIVCATY